LVAIRAIDLLAQNGTATDAAQDTAQRVRQIVDRRAASGFPEQVASQGVIVDLAAERSAAAVVVFLQSQRIDRERRAASPVGRTLQNPVAGRIGDVLLAALGARAHADQAIEQVRGYSGG